MDLTKMGWNSQLQEQYLPYADQGYTVGRISSEHRSFYRLFTEHGELLAEVTGKMRFQASGRGDYPAVGDWVLVKIRESGEHASIHHIFERKSKFSRKIAGFITDEQIVAANVDTVFLVNALNNDFNLRRLERYLILAWESGANPVIVLSKADLCENIARIVAEVESVAIGVPIHVISSITKEGLKELAPYLNQGQTVALLGSSGVGKSTLINCLAGEEIQQVNEIRQGDDRGKHTTTYRQLIMLPDGGMIMDTPGMRELQLWEADEGISSAFQDIESLAEGCRFKDCRHHQEPGCAIKAALQNGILDRGRFNNYQKTQRELARLALKMSNSLRTAEKERGKKQSKFLKGIKK